MTYRFKKRLLRVVYYLTSLAILSFLYIEAAHRKILPAVFEYYTGNWVRNYTANFYQTKSQKKSVSFSLHWHDILDILTQEPGYLAARNLLEHYLKIWELLPYHLHRKEVLLSLANDVTLIEWLRNPKSRFADVYQYEFLSRMDSYRYILGYRIVDAQERELYRSRNFDEKIVSLPLEKKMLLHKKGFSVPIWSEEELVGYLQGSWDPAWFPEVPGGSLNQEMGFISLLLTPGNFLVNPDLELEEIKNYFISVEGKRKYIGPLVGRVANYRFVSAKLEGFTAVVIFKAAGWSFYAFQIALFLLAIVVSYVCYVLLIRLKDYLNQNPLLRRSTWLEEDLKASYALHQQSLNLLAESSHHFKKLSNRQTETLNFIANRLATLVIANTTPPEKLVVEQNQLTSATSSFSPTVASLPEPKILSPEADDSITVIDEMPAAVTLPNLEPKEALSQKDKQQAPSPPKEIDVLAEDKELEELFEELAEENFSELLGDFPLQAPEELPLAAEKAIVDEEPLPVKKAKGSPPMSTLFLSLVENLEKASWEIEEKPTSWQSHEEEDLEILCIDTPPVELLSPKDTKEEASQPAESADTILFEDEEIGNFVTSKTAEQNLTPSFRRANFQYKLEPEILPLEIKPKALVLQEKLDIKKTTLTITQPHEKHEKKE